MSGSSPLTTLSGQIRAVADRIVQSHAREAVKLATLAREVAAMGGENRMTTTLPRPTPHLDRVTVFRLVLDDFPLEPGELELLSDPAERYRLDDALRETADLDAITAEAVRMWRERRER